MSHPWLDEIHALEAQLTAHVEQGRPLRVEDHFLGRYEAYVAVMHSIYVVHDIACDNGLRRYLEPRDPVFDLCRPTPQALLDRIVWSSFINGADAVQESGFSSAVGLDALLLEEPWPACNERSVLVGPWPGRCGAENAARIMRHLGDPAEIVSIYWTVSAYNAKFVERVSVEPLRGWVASFEEGTEDEADRPERVLADHGGFEIVSDHGARVTLVGCGRGTASAIETDPRIGSFGVTADVPVARLEELGLGQRSLGEALGPGLPALEAVDPNLSPEDAAWFEARRCDRRASERAEQMRLGAFDAPVAASENCGWCGASVPRGQLACSGCGHVFASDAEVQRALRQNDADDEAWEEIEEESSLEIGGASWVMGHFRLMGLFALVAFNVMSALLPEIDLEGQVWGNVSIFAMFAVCWWGFSIDLRDRD